MDTERFPLIPLKDMVVFPQMVLPLLIGRTKSIGAAEAGASMGSPVFLCAQRDIEVENPGVDDLSRTGVIANLIQTVRLPDGSVKAVVEGIQRAQLMRVRERDGYQEALVEILEAEAEPDESSVALVRITRDQFDEYVKLGQRIAPEVAMSLRSVEEPTAIADLVCAHLSLRASERQELLDLDTTRARLERVNTYLQREIDLFHLERKARDHVRDQMDRGQREHYLQEQLRVIQQELGGRAEAGDEISELEAQIRKARMPKEVREKAERELTRYERMPPMSPESVVARTYIEWLVEMPWNKRTRDDIDLERAERVLNEDHFGLEKVKERILDFLAVRKLSKSTKGPILCLVGPPGVGKTSLGKSIARAIKRKFVRVSLGGVRDEAEIRGHRRTYIGSMPGRILQSIKKSGVKNPLFLLDEVDKMSMDYRGDPSSALLEVLDPEQNMAFSDHYLEVDFDLHEVFFITTANSEFDIPDALFDRMEVVRLAGYTTFEKEAIAREFLIPKQLKESGLTPADLAISKKALDVIISRYTHEAGVRELERQIATVCRKVARQVVARNGSPGRKVVVSDKRIFSMLGPPAYQDVTAELEARVGVSVGLAWTQGGGDTLIIETTVMKGKGELRLTGQLGEVMQESAQAAYTWLRVHAKDLAIPTEFWKNVDVHVHVPEGAIPKDGPSAGSAIAVSMLSALRKKPPRAQVALTGEITLRGRVLPVGGVKEKVIAAHRAQMKSLLLPAENEKDLVEVPKQVLRDLNIELVDSIGRVVELSFPRVKAPRKRTVKK